MNFLVFEWELDPEQNQFEFLSFKNSGNKSCFFLKSQNQIHACMWIAPQGTRIDRAKKNFDESLITACSTKMFVKGPPFLRKFKAVRLACDWWSVAALLLSRGTRVIVETVTRNVPLTETDRKWIDVCVALCLLTCTAFILCCMFLWLKRKNPDPVASKWPNVSRAWYFFSYLVHYLDRHRASL